jgi:hypothetical protein
MVRRMLVVIEPKNKGIPLSKYKTKYTYTGADVVIASCISFLMAFLLGVML